jgi:hypothetical protein
MLHILKLTPKQTVGRWVQLMDEVASLGGASVLLIHPDYEFASNENLEHYDELLELGSNMGTLGEAASRSGQQG